MSAIEEQIKDMIEKANEAEGSNDALRFSQAGLNAAHAARLLYDMKDRT